MSHSTPLYCLAFYRGFSGPPLMHRLAQPSWDGLLVPSQNASFADKSYTAPLLMVSFTDRPLATQVLLRPFNKTMYHSPGCPAVQVWNGVWKCLCPTLGAKLLSWIFLPFLQGEAQALGQQGYKTLRLWTDY